MATRKIGDLRVTPRLSGPRIERRLSREDLSVNNAKMAFPESNYTYTVRRKTPSRNIVLRIINMEPEETFEVAITFLDKRPGTITINARPD